MSNNKKKGSRLNWFIGIFISILAAGGGIVALLEYNDSVKTKENKNHQKQLTDWENFSPESLSLGVQNVTLLGSAPFDLESGHTTTGFSNKTTDIFFGCWPQGNESLRASKGVSWSDQGVINFENIKYRKIRDAKFVSKKHKKSKNFDLYYDHKSNVPRKGHVFFIKTVEGNVAKIQIIDYISDANPQVCRSMKLKYEVFPVVKDPPKPKK
ncbi:MAG: hypothetical protein V7719_15255 [Psychroserpens sp.]